MVKSHVDNIFPSPRFYSHSCSFSSFRRKQLFGTVENRKTSKTKWVGQRPLSSRKLSEAPMKATLRINILLFFSEKIAFCKIKITDNKFYGLV